MEDVTSAPGMAIEERLDQRIALRPARQARTLLHIGFVAAPLLAGADKFTNLLCDWEDYLAPQLVSRIHPKRRRSFMRVVGVVEMAAGALVAVRPRIGGYVVAGWLAGIITNLVAGRRAYDVALRDLGLALGAIALARLNAAEPTRAATIH